MSALPPSTPPLKPEALEHCSRARQNFRLYEELKGREEYLDWAITLLFYTALHLVQAYLVQIATSGFDIPHGHEDRMRTIRLRLIQVDRQYSHLESRSRS